MSSILTIQFFNSISTVKNSFLYATQKHRLVYAK